MLALSGGRLARMRAAEDLFHRQDEILDDGINLALPPLAVERAVMTDVGLQMMAFEMRP